MNSKSISKLGQELLNLATDTNSEYVFKDSSSFSQEVTCVSSNNYESFVDENGELKYKKLSLRFNYTDKWTDIFRITLVCIEGFSLDEYPGERAEHHYIKLKNIDKIIELLKKNNHPVSESRILNKI
jgi:hypothetical protein